MTEQTHYIDFDKLKDSAHVGVRRAVIFLGLSLNAAHREDFLDYELSKIPSSTGERRFPLKFFPEALPVERVNDFKVLFARWIQDCCLCGLLEHHALILDKIHLHALVVYRSLGKLAEKDDSEKLHNKCRHDGIPGKHKALRERFGIETTHSATIDQLYEARNALTHDFGVVLPKRCDASGNFVLRWPKFDFIGIGNETGKERPLAAMIGERTTEDTTIALRVVPRETTYKLGERIKVTTEDLVDVLHFFAGWAIPSTLTAFADFLAANGIRQESEPPLEQKSARACSKSPGSDTTMKKTTTTTMKKSKNGPEAEEGASPSELIDARINELGDWRGETLARVRALIHEAEPEVVETWKWRGVPVWEHAGIICTGETYKAIVKLTFAKGASLDDPSRLFNSSLEGNTRRAIDIREGDKIDEKALKALIRAAVALNTSKGATTRPVRSPKKSKSA